MENLISSIALSSQRSNPISPVSSGLWTDYFEPRWYAAYIWANHEKRVAEQLAQRSVEYFLPLYESVRRWKDRNVHLHLPLFPGYVFFRIALRDRSQVLQIPRVVRLIGFNGTPTTMPDQEMAAVREGLSRQSRVEPHPYLTVGRRVRIRAGAFQGLEGILLRKKGNFRVVLSLDLIQRSIVVDVDAGDVEALASRRKLRMS